MCRCFIPVRLHVQEGSCQNAGTVPNGGSGESDVVRAERLTRMETTFTLTGQQVREDVGNLKQSVAAVSDKVKADVKVELGSVERVLTGKIDAVEKTVKTEVGAVEKTLKTEIGEKIGATQKTFTSLERLVYIMIGIIIFRPYAEKAVFGESAGKPHV